MELWDIYDADKKPTGRTMKRNDWCLKDGEYHLTVLGVVARPESNVSYHKARHDKGMGTGLVGSIRRRSTGWRGVLRGSPSRSERGDRTGCRKCRGRLFIYL